MESSRLQSYCKVYHHILKRSFSMYISFLAYGINRFMESRV